MINSNRYRDRKVETKYYFKRLFKISTTFCRATNRFVKIYEKRRAVGEPWIFIRGTAFDLSRVYV